MNYGFVKSKLTGKETEFTSVKTLPEKFRYNLPEVFDQGDQPICSACSTHAFLFWEYHKSYNLNTLFKYSKPTKEGAELKNVFEYLKKEKLIDDYALIKSYKALQTAILLNGPCIAALPVYNDSMKFWNGEGLLGGHAIAVVGWNEDGFVIRNSWGAHWGSNGYTILPYDDFNKFIEIWTLIK